MALARAFGTGAATSSFDDLENARTILVFGANATENHPVVGARIRRAARKGARLVVVDPRRTALAEAADVHLQIRPGTNLPLLLAMARVILNERYADASFLSARVDGLALFRESVAAWIPDLAARVCGVPAALIEEAARLYALEKPSISFHGLGATEHVQGTDAVTALANLALLTGNVGRPGTGVNPLRGQNNVQGAAHMGCEPDHLAGYATVRDGRALVEATVGAPMPSEKGLSLPGMLDAARSGRLHALWAIGYDILLTNPDAKSTAEALAALDLLVVQDLFLNETAKRFAHVFLPAAASYEKEGTFMNAERRVQRVRRVVAPPGEAKPDWEILGDVAKAMGKGALFPYRSAEEIWDEVRSVWPGGRGLTYRRLDERGLQWPCASEEDPGTERLHAAAFTSGPRARLQPLTYDATPEVTSPEFPFLLTTGRTLLRFNAGTMTSRTKNALLEPTDTLGISPADAALLAVGEGDRVRVTSRYGEANLPIALRDDLRPGEVFSTFHDPAVFLNSLTSPRADAETGTPEYKVTAVQVAKAP
jgi:formate dehydrogenase major subunit